MLSSVLWRYNQNITCIYVRFAIPSGNEVSVRMWISVLSNAKPFTMSWYVLATTNATDYRELIADCVCVCVRTNKIPSRLASLFHFQSLHLLLVCLFPPIWFWRTFSFCMPSFRIFTPSESARLSHSQLAKMRWCHFIAYLRLPATMNEILCVGNSTTIEYY